MNVESIGARLYRKLTTPVYSEDGKFYVNGCIVRGEGGAVKVVFLRYEKGKGIVGRAKPSKEMAEWLKRYGRELKEFLNQIDLQGGQVTDRPPRALGSSRRKILPTPNGRGKRNLLTNEKREETHE